MLIPERGDEEGEGDGRGTEAEEEREGGGVRRGVGYGREREGEREGERLGGERGGEEEVEREGGRGGDADSGREGRMVVTDSNIISIKHSLLSNTHLYLKYKVYVWLGGLLGGEGGGVGLMKKNKNMVEKFYFSYCTIDSTTF